VLWIASVLVVVAAVVLIAATLRGTAQATTELRDEAMRLGELRSALENLQVEAGVTRQAIDGIRARSRRRPVAR
jgi:hypothetical protein